MAERNFIEGIKAPTFLRAPIKFRRKNQRQHLKRWFSLKNRPTHFHINSISVLRLVKLTSWVFSALKSTSHFLPQSTLSCWSDSSSETNPSCCHKSDAWSHLEVGSSIISIYSNITDNIIRKKYTVGKVQDQEWKLEEL